ncbi:MAG: ATP-binding domain-containing protein, partial [Pseudomonadota bacterium]
VIFEGSDGRARACFPSTDGDADARRFAPSQLPPHETCYAMTIHKSQGSEFDEVLVVLPEEGSEGEHRLLARELIYTGVTRARKAVEIWGQPEMLAAAVTRGNRRYSGLPERLRASRSVDGD